MAKNSQLSLCGKRNGKKHKRISYARYGYRFLLPFALVFLVFQFIPLITTFIYGFCNYYEDGLNTVGPSFAGFDRFKVILGPDSNFWKYRGNTRIIWIIGFLPQVICSLLLALFFTSERLKLKGKRFFQTVTYRPNLVMASAFGYMFLQFFSQGGPVNQILQAMKIVSTPVIFRESAAWQRVIIALINFLMWFGNTSILLRSGIMGIDESLFESARLDGASSFRIFWKITLPLLRPIFVYFLITSMIGGIQLFDAAQIFTSGTGGVQAKSRTIRMYLFNLVQQKHNYGEAGAVSIRLFVITGLLSLIVFKFRVPHQNSEKREKRSKNKRLRFEAKAEKEKRKREERKGVSQ